jgi:hypothetical protein
MRISAPIERGALLVLLLGVAAGGVAYASIPDSSGVIHGCYKTSNGQLRVIDTGLGQTCHNENAISWSQQGPPGPPGPAGSALEYAAIGSSAAHPPFPLYESKGILSVTHPSTGVWCFQLASPAHVAVASMTGIAGLGNEIIHTSLTVGSSCPGAIDFSTAAVSVRLPDGSPTNGDGFSIEFN